MRQGLSARRKISFLVIVPGLSTSSSSSSSSTSFPQGASSTSPSPAKLQSDDTYDQASGDRGDLPLTKKKRGQQSSNEKSIARSSRVAVLRRGGGERQSHWSAGADESDEYQCLSKSRPDRDHDRAEKGCGDTNTNVRKTPRLHEDRTTRDTRPNHTTTGLALLSSLTLETRSHPWVPAGHPQYTGAHHDGKAVDGPKPPQLTRKTTAHSNMVGEQVWTYGLVETFVTVSVMTAG